MLQLIGRSSCDFAFYVTTIVTAAGASVTLLEMDEQILDACARHSMPIWTQYWMTGNMSLSIMEIRKRNSITFTSDTRNMFHQFFSTQAAVVNDLENYIREIEPEGHELRRCYL